MTVYRDRSRRRRIARVGRLASLAGAAVCAGVAATALYVGHNANALLFTVLAAIWGAAALIFTAA